MITPEELEKYSFHLGLIGYRQSEVDKTISHMMMEYENAYDAYGKSELLRQNMQLTIEDLNLKLYEANKQIEQLNVALQKEKKDKKQAPVSPVTKPKPTISPKPQCQPTSAAQPDIVTNPAAVQETKVIPHQKFATQDSMPHIDHVTSSEMLRDDQPKFQHTERLDLQEEIYEGEVESKVSSSLLETDDGGEIEFL